MRACTTTTLSYYRVLCVTILLYSDVHIYIPIFLSSCLPCPSPDLLTMTACCVPVLRLIICQASNLRGASLALLQSKFRSLHKRWHAFKQCDRPLTCSCFTLSADRLIGATRNDDDSTATVPPIRRTSYRPIRQTSYRPPHQTDFLQIGECGN